MNSLFASILPVQALGIEIAEWSGDRIVLTAPLAKNLNDKGSAFAGSIDSMLDLAGWSAITLTLREAGIKADVMIAKSETHYAAAVRGDMTASTRLARDDAATLCNELRDSGRGSAALTVRLAAGETVCAEMHAQYAVRCR